MREHLLEKPAKYPGCSGARNLSDNFADLRAQTGANQKGITLIGQLVEEYGLETVLVCFPQWQQAELSTISPWKRRNLIINLS
jgi:5-oxoprolinase (ATP-hydrolysing)